MCDKETHTYLMYIQPHILVQGHWLDILSTSGRIVLTLVAAYLLTCFQISPLDFLTHVEELISVSCLHFSRD